MSILEGRCTVVLGVGAVALLTSLYVLWGPSKRKPKKRDLCPGLVNLGNICFLNALLQALAPCRSISDWLNYCRFDRKRHIGQNGLQSLVSTLSKSLNVLNNESVEHTEEFNASDILVALRQRRWVISSDQQDAHELYHVFTETLEEEVAKFPRVLPLFDVCRIEDGEISRFQNENTARSRCNLKLPLLPDKDVDQPFRGLLASQLKCTSCAYKCPIRYDTFDSLSLSIPATPNISELSLERLLRRYVAAETVQNVECEGCSRRIKSLPKNSLQLQGEPNTSKATFVKKLSLGKLPQCLCIHIQRITWMNNGTPVRRFDHVTYPEILDMGSYMYKKLSKHIRPNTLDLESTTTGLVGGRKNCTYAKSNSRKSPSPSVSVPYSGPVNLLKALNYTTRTTLNGFYIQPQSKNRRIDSPTSPVAERLAQAYSLETAGLASQSNSYKLMSVIVHHGDESSGHFVTYRRVPSTNGQHFPSRWLYTSDNQVRKANLSEVLNSDAYMLFYEKL